MEVPVYNESGAVAGKITLREDVWNAPMNKTLLYQVIKVYLANRRQGTASTKRRGEVSGGGKKPWRQKGTGRARTGSIRSPHWRGGGNIFGPKPRDYDQDIPKKARRAALRAVLSDKVKSDNVFVVQNLSFSEPKTKKMAEILKNLKLNCKGVLLCLPEKDENVLKSARNLCGVQTRPAGTLNAYDVMTAKKLMLTADAVKKIEALYSKESDGKRGTEKAA